MHFDTGFSPGLGGDSPVGGKVYIPCHASPYNRKFPDKLIQAFLKQQAIRDAIQHEDDLRDIAGTGFPFQHIIEGVYDPVGT